MADAIKDRGPMPPETTLMRSDQALSALVAVAVTILVAPSLSISGSARAQGAAPTLPRAELPIPDGFTVAPPVPSQQPPSHSQDLNQEISPESRDQPYNHQPGGCRYRNQKLDLIV